MSPQSLPTFTLTHHSFPISLLKSRTYNTPFKKSRQFNLQALISPLVNSASRIHAIEVQDFGQTAVVTPIGVGSNAVVTSALDVQRDDVERLLVGRFKHKICHSCKANIATSNRRSAIIPQHKYHIKQAICHNPSAQIPQHQTDDLS